MAIDLERFINFVNVELPKRIVLLHGSKYTGDPNLSSDSKVNYSPPGSFYMDYDSKILWQKKDTTKESWQKTGKSDDDIKELLSDSIIAGDNILLDFDSDTGKLTITGKPLTSEQVQDIIGPTMVGGENTSIIYDDDNDQIVIDNDRTDDDIISLINNTLTTGDFIKITFDNDNKTIEIKNTMSSEDIAELLSSNLIGGDNVSITYDNETGEIKIDSPVIPEEDVKAIIKAYLYGGKNISLVEDDDGVLKIDSDQDALEILKNELPNYLTAGSNITITRNEDNSIMEISTTETLKDNLMDYIKAGNNISINQDSSTNEITINSTATGTGGIVTKDAVFSLGSELVLGSQEQSEMILPYEANINSLTVNIGMASSNESNLIFSLDRWDNQKDSWVQLETFELQVEKNNQSYDTDINVNHDRVRISLVSGDFENATNMTVIIKLQSGEAIEGDKDIVFMLGSSLDLGVQDNTEMYIPYEKVLDAILVNKGIGSTNSENLEITIEYYNTNTDNWSTFGNIELPADQSTIEVTAGVDISYPTYRIRLVSGDYNNVSNMSVILRLKN